ncbi:MAG: OmpH family outer membrane protein [Proteobacteria bacterium]|nr:OmpH family outer membrane protein [Pseudomonadota bacterium]
MPRFVLILTTLSLFMATPALAEGPKLGIVDFQRALNEVEEGRTAKATLEGRYEQARLEVEAKRAAIEQMAADLEAQKPMLSADALREKESEYQAKMIEFQQIMMEQQQTMAMMEQELTGDILEKLYAVAGTIGAEGGYNLIVEASAVVYVNGTVDITEQVIARFNNKAE